jgi:peptidoglycan-associated lipoprotein
MMHRFGYFAATIVIVGMTTAACGGKKPETPNIPPPPAPTPTATTPSSPPPPPSPPPTPAPAAPTEDEIFAKMTNDEVAKKYLTDVFFEYDSIEIAEPQRASLQKNAAFLKQRQSVRILIEGHADSRGTNEYNLALGERRAHAVRDYLSSRGISADRFQTVSYGEERPKHDNAREETRRLNRRAALVVRLQR